MPAGRRTAKLQQLWDEQQSSQSVKRPDGCQAGCQEGRAPTDATSPGECLEGEGHEDQTQKGRQQIGNG
jgi:hypothetical protein